MIVLGVRWVAREGEEERVADLLRRLVEPSRAESGCLQYGPHRDPDDPRVFFLFEQWADEDALRAHEESPHVQDLLFGQVLPLWRSASAPTGCRSPEQSTRRTHRIDRGTRRALLRRADVSPADRAPGCCSR